MYAVNDSLESVREALGMRFEASCRVASAEEAVVHVDMVLAAVLQPRLDHPMSGGGASAADAAFSPKRGEASGAEGSQNSERPSGNVTSTTAPMI